MQTVGVLGGEPTLHPGFTDVVNQIIDAKMNVRLFTGGIISSGMIKYLKSLPYDRIRIIINLASGEACHTKQCEQILASLKYLSDRAMISYTITQPDQDLVHLSDLAGDLGTLPFIRLGIMLPRVEQDKHGLEPSKYGDLATPIMRLSRACHRRNISLEFDCGFTRCMFTPEEISQLTHANCHPRFVCSPIIDIGCDLQTWSCFPLQQLTQFKLDDFSTREALVDQFSQTQAPYRTFGVYDTCHQCAYKLKGQCAGGCLAHTIRSFNKNTSSWRKEGAH